MNQDYGLSQRSLDTLRGVFSKYGALNKVILYGSRAMGTHKNGSDIDITLEVGEGFSEFDLLRVCGDLDESDLPYFVDCSILSEIGSQDLREHIERVGKVLYERRQVQ